MSWLEAIGWIGSALVVVSLTQARILRFRWMNLIGSIVATGYNLALGIWPFVAMNAAIAVINAYWIVKLTRDRHDGAQYEVIEVPDDDPYLCHVLAAHRSDIATTHPSFTADAEARGSDGESRAAFLVLRGDETVGVVIVRDAGDGVGGVELDWVTPRYRDFTPGEFVYQRSGVFSAHGFARLELVDDVASSRDYYQEVGFERRDGRWRRDVELAA